MVGNYECKENKFTGISRFYLDNLYKRTMREAYKLAFQEVRDALNGDCLDCGAYDGYHQKNIGIKENSYHGIEWDRNLVAKMKNLKYGDLNESLPYGSNKFNCVFAFSVIEHLLKPVHFLNECYRVLENCGTLVLLTPNISTYFTAFQILKGDMPSTAPYLDNVENTVNFRHLIAWSFRRLIKELKYIGFDNVKGRGFGLYPFPNFAQPVLERIDPYHCHQMVITAKKGKR